MSFLYATTFINRLIRTAVGVRIMCCSVTDSEWLAVLDHGGRNWDEVWTHVSAVGPALRRAYSLFIGEAFSIMGLLWLFAHSYDMSLLGV